MGPRLALLLPLFAVLWLGLAGPGPGPGAARADGPAEDPALEPARVVVAFDRERIEPLIVEGIAERTSGRSVAANDPVRIASISKLVMALAALRLAEAGVVDLQADISDYLGWRVRAPGFPDVPVTLAQILSHRAGLRDAGGYIVPLGESLREKLADPRSWHADAPPGDAPFAYANLGSPVVASVLEAASGERYDVLLERLVFAPLGIEACVNWTRCSPGRIARAVALYRDTGEPARDFPGDLPPDCAIPVARGVPCDLSDYVPGSNASVFSPQGGVRIGMVDLARIGQALVRGGEGIVSEQGLAAMLASARPRVAGQPYFCGYGRGIQAIETPGRTCLDDLFGDGAVRFGHPGEAYGLRAGLWFDPATGQGLAYFLTAVPPRIGAEGASGFDPREIALVQRALRLQAGRQAMRP
ncbi:MAG: serine hydrolase [Erythrobacter sp.]|uniref:serine hydrolase domain-containing protein n=1 Tax=Erythrobacter sp. TaxID=1042 RepID=UPI0032F04B85